MPLSNIKFTNKTKTTQDPWNSGKDINSTSIRLILTTRNYLHNIKLYFFCKVELPFLRGSSFGHMWHDFAPGRPALPCLPSHPPGVFAICGRVDPVSLWKMHDTRPELIQNFISFPACLLNDREKCFTCCWDNMMARQNSKPYHAL